MESTDIHIPTEVHALLEATAIANGYETEEMVLAAIEAFLECDREPHAPTD
jgi:hypothetical protein